MDVKDVFGSRSPLVRALHIPFFSHSRRAWINTLLARQAVTPFECETVSRFETERLKHGLCERLDFVRVLKLHQAIACRGCLQSPTCARTHTRHTHTHTHIERTVLTYTCWGERECPCQVTTTCPAHVAPNRNAPTRHRHRPRSFMAPPRRVALELLLNKFVCVWHCRRLCPISG